LKDFEDRKIKKQKAPIRRGFCFLTFLFICHLQVNQTQELAKYFKG